jgi:hypothetical protein
MPVQPKPCHFMPYWPLKLQPTPVQPKPAEISPKVIIVPNMNKVIEAIDRVIINKISNKHDSGIREFKPAKVEESPRIIVTSDINQINSAIDRVIANKISNNSK